MATVRDDIITLLKNLPENASVEDIIEAIIVRQKILRGLKDSTDGHYYSQEEAKALLEKWLQ